MRRRSIVPRWTKLAVVRRYDPTERGAAYYEREAEVAGRALLAVARTSPSVSSEVSIPAGLAGRALPPPWEAGTSHSARF